MIALESLMLLIDNSSVLRMALIQESKAFANKIQTSTCRLTLLSENGTDSYNQKKTEKIRTLQQVLKFLIRSKNTKAGEMMLQKESKFLIK